MRPNPTPHHRPDPPRGYFSPGWQLSFSAGQAILSERERGEVFFIVKEGAVAPRAPSAPAGAPPPAGAPRLGPGEFFGERALLSPSSGAFSGGSWSGSGSGSGSSSGARGGGEGWDYYADSQRVVVLAMRRAEFERLLGPYEELWRWAGARRCLWRPGVCPRSLVVCACNPVASTIAFKFSLVLPACIFEGHALLA
jgi:hypothetical protein